MKYIHYSFIAFLFLATAMCPLAAICSAKVASVGSKAIDASRLAEVIKEMSQNYGTEELASSEICGVIKSEALDRLVTDLLLEEEAKKRKITISKEDFEKWLSEQGVENPPKSWLEKQKQRLTNRQLIEQILDERLPIDEDKIREYYEKNSSEFTSSTKWHVKEITVHTRNTARVVLSRLKKNEDFSKVAKELSLSDTASDGGDIGFVSSANLPSETALVFKNMPKGSVSPAFESPMGYQIFQIVDIKAAELKSLESVKKEITDILRSNRRAEVLEKWFEELKEKRRIKINEEKLKEIKCYTPK